MWRLFLEGGFLFLVAMTTFPYTCRTKSPEATFQVAKVFSSFLEQGAVVFLQGELGSGKTHFTRGLCAGLGMENLFEVDSPTYTLVNHYDVQSGVDHLDLYRFNDPEALEEIDLAGLIASPSIKVIEWPERLVGFPISRVDFLVQLEILGENERELFIQSTAEVYS